MNKIKEVIALTGLRKNWIADKMGVPASHISMWISEERKMNKDRVKSMCKLLNCKVVDLFPKEEDGNG